MPCTVVDFGNGSRGFVCTSRPRFRLCACGSGQRATLQCDWKVPTRHSGTCDGWICPPATHRPDPHNGPRPPTAGDAAAGSAPPPQPQKAADA